MLVYVRPSNEHILIVRVPGSQNQCGYPYIFLSWGLCEQKGSLPAHSHSLDCLEIQFCLHSFKYKEFQECLVGDISLVGQCLELIQKRFW